MKTWLKRACAGAVLAAACWSMDTPANEATTEPEPESEKQEGIHAMSDGTTVLYETQVDDGGVAALDVDYTTYTSTFSLVEEAYDNFVYPVTIITQDEDGNEVQRRVLDDFDALGEDDVWGAAIVRVDLVDKLTADPADSVALAGIKLIQDAIADSEIPADVLPYYIAIIRGLGEDGS